MDKKIIKTYSPKEAREMIPNMLKTPIDIEYVLENLGKDLLPKYLNGNEKEKEEAMKKLQGMSVDLFRSLELETQVGLMESIDERYRATAKNLTEKIILENDCKKTEEKMLAEVIVSAFIKILDNSRRLTNEYNCVNITPNRNNYIATLSKQIDRANRQYLSALMSLKQLKSPSINMSIKTNNAFVSSNQQINVNKKNNEA